MKNIQHVRTTLEDLIAMTVTLQPRMITTSDMKPVAESPQTWASGFYLNECVHCQSSGIHRPSNWSVRYAHVEVNNFTPAKTLVIRRGSQNVEEVCNDHIKDVMENIRDYYQAVFEEVEAR